MARPRPDEEPVTIAVLPSRVRNEGREEGLRKVDEERVRIERVVLYDAVEGR